MVVMIMVVMIVMMLSIGINDDHDAIDSNDVIMIILLR